jgi:hypothetical protein
MIQLWLIAVLMVTHNLNHFHAITGLDSHSVEIPVNFISDTDLHLTGSSIGNINLVGTYSGITDDIDGNPRSATRP